MGHTPGPWKAIRNSCYYEIRAGYTAGMGDIGDMGPSIASVLGDDNYSHTNGTKEASNAYLMAAAPDLLEALELAMRMKDLWAPPDDYVPEPCNAGEMQALSSMLATITSAIAKAKGE